MGESILEPKPLSPHAPRIVSVKIPADRISELIGPGGKNIKGIQAESGAEINIEDDGTVHIYASKQEGLDRAKAMIDRMFQEIEVGKVYTGKVVSIISKSYFKILYYFKIPYNISKSHTKCKNSPRQAG